MAGVVFQDAVLDHAEPLLVKHRMEFQAQRVFAPLVEVTAREREGESESESESERESESESERYLKVRCLKPLVSTHVAVSQDQDI